MQKKITEKDNEKLKKLYKEIINITGNAFIACNVKREDDEGESEYTVGCCVGSTLELAVSICQSLTNTLGLARAVEHGLGVVTSKIEFSKEN
jgi:hypothetical protein